LRSFVIPKTIEEVPERCFANCRSLYGIRFEEGSVVSKLGKEAFSESGIFAFSLPSSLKIIEDGCFEKCGDLRELTIPPDSELTQFGRSWISQTKIYNLEIPEKCDVIAGGCLDNLEKITVSRKNHLIVIENNILYSRNRRTLIWYLGKEPKLTIPNSVERLGERCFYNCEFLREVVFQERPHIRTIGKEAFFGCKDLKITIPSSVRFIGENAFDASTVAKRTAHISDWISALNFDDYEEVSLLGKEVKLWQHRVTKDKIVVKTLPWISDASSSSDKEKLEDSQQRFVREVENLSRIEHPCIVSLRGYVLPCDGHGPLVITEYCTGGSLKDVLLKQPTWWGNNQKAKTIAGMVRGMIVVHSREIMHRDLKPDNIFFSNEFGVKIADFGSSRFWNVDVTQTATGTGFTPLYMAPEVIEGKYDFKVDVYSFGLILYEIIVGYLVFSRPGDKLKLFADLFKGKRPEIPNDVLSAGKRLIEKCWAEDPKERPDFVQIWGMLRSCEFQVVPGVNFDLVKQYVESVMTYSCLEE
jgi:serine/threonine protein kinase